jgi:hypothetical protein
VGTAPNVVGRGEREKERNRVEGCHCFLPSERGERACVCLCVCARARAGRRCLCEFAMKVCTCMHIHASIQMQCDANACVCARVCVCVCACACTRSLLVCLTVAQSSLLRLRALPFDDCLVMLRHLSLRLTDVRDEWNPPRPSMYLDNEWKVSAKSL